jgi:hypothetical protein
LKQTYLRAQILAHVTAEHAREKPILSASDTTNNKETTKNKNHKHTWQQRYFDMSPLSTRERSQYCVQGWQSDAMQHMPQSAHGAFSSLFVDQHQECFISFLVNVAFVWMCDCSVGKASQTNAVHATNLRCVKHACTEAVRIVFRRPAVKAATAKHKYRNNNQTKIKQKMLFDELTLC